MATELPPDPYLALAVPRDASAGAIKTSYRKLVLKFHPDKVADEAQKQAAADQFHKIQTAYEIIGDEDRRARYDAQCKLAELRREVMQRQGTAGPRVEVRTAGPRMGTDSPGRASVFTSRGPERSDRVNVEERRPFDTEYFDRPRTSARKDYEYERPKRTSPRDDRDRAKASRQDTKENDKYRQKEKVKSASKDARRDRGHKHAYAEPSTESDSDDATRRRREMDEDPRRARDALYESAKRQQEENLRSAYMDERSRKMFADVSTAREYIERSKAPSSRQYPEIIDDRPLPPRQGKSDKVEYIRRGEAGKSPVMVRKSSARPSMPDRDFEEPSRHSPRERGERRRRSSNEITEEATRRPPTLAQAKSAPGNIRMPEEVRRADEGRRFEEARRAHSLQTDFDQKDEYRPPLMRRADSLPMPPTTRKPAKPSTLRNTEMVNGLPTPSVTPDSPTSPVKYNYGTQYADDYEYPTPAGYRTEVREPGPVGGRKLTRSPSPMKEERPRVASSRQPPSAARPSPTNTRTTSYKIPDGAPARPPMPHRESSRQASVLYGEVPTTSSPKNRSRYSPPADEVRFAKVPRPEQVRVASGYSTSGRKGSEQRPSYSRTDSYAQAHPVSAR